MDQDEQRNKLFLAHLGQHLVAMCGSYVYVDEKGEVVGPPRFYSYTGTVFEIGDKWCIATAGHCLKRLEEAKNHPQVRVESEVLADYFGPSATNQTPLPFKPLEQGFMYVDEGGLDFGLVVVSDLWRQNLTTNGVIPFTSKQWHFPAQQNFESFAMVGFPDEYTGSYPSSDPKVMMGYVNPVYVPVRRLSDDTSMTFPRFKGEIIDMGSQEGIKGMSGGPIFGFFGETGETKYLLIALQSSWDERSVVYGCLIPEMMRCIEVKLNNYKANLAPNK